ncbi:MAG: cytochrome c [Rhodocyclaceae bacterium]|nr:cytochrome c [Rhodocyclaceae bacterium]MCA3025427.1 cytochrome c [Rhodocyclaceae bacterium]MCA3031645.1 cytochrome c [Rhodocyclaceae bacterium]MCA3038292.1 cytochrome c [Rhodocyclaceae bacterium]MCA3047022.1 cytochrome c [Rhodocyclaceae bacterium]
MGRLNQIASKSRWVAAGFAAMLFAGLTGQVHAQFGDIAAGKLLYEGDATCVGCHGAPRSSSAGTATTVAKLNAAINNPNIGSMQFLRTFLSADDVCNIVTYIASQVGAPDPRCPTGVTKNSIVLRSSSTTNPQMQVGKLANSVLEFSSITDPGPAYRMLGYSDFNRNGTPDLAFQNITQGEFGDVNAWNEFKSSNPVFWRQVKQVWDVQAVGDLDGDGVDDLVWRYVVLDSPDTGVSYIWFGSGGAVAPVVNQVRKRGGAPLDWQLLGAVDINSDGAADMLYLSPAGQLRALMATPGRTCANLAVGNLPPGFAPLKFAKFRGGATGEVLVRNATTGENRLLSLSAAGLALPPYTGAPDDQNASCTSSALTVPMTTISLPATDPTWTFYAAADLDNTGTVDIIWRRPTGQLTVWLLRADGSLLTQLTNAGTAPANFSPLQNGGPKLF